MRDRGRREGGTAGTKRVQKRRKEGTEKKGRIRWMVLKEEVKDRETKKKKGAEGRREAGREGKKVGEMVWVREKKCMGNVETAVRR